MNEKDRIGNRGENIFSVLITKRCNGRYWFDETFLGEKAEAKDFLVTLVDPSSNEASFYVQVKSTSKGYAGAGLARKLKVNVTKKDVRKLKKLNRPVYVVGIDVELERGYLVAITQLSAGGLRGIPTTHPLNCNSLKALWKEMDEFWKTRDMLPSSSHFS